MLGQSGRIWDQTTTLLQRSLLWPSSLPLFKDFTLLYRLCWCSLPNCSLSYFSRSYFHYCIRLNVFNSLFQNKEFFNDNFFQSCSLFWTIFPRSLFTDVSCLHLYVCMCYVWMGESLLWGSILHMTELGKSLKEIKLREALPQTMPMWSLQVQRLSMRRLTYLNAWTDSIANYKDIWYHCRAEGDICVEDHTKYLICQWCKYCNKTVMRQRQKTFGQTK